MRDDPESTSTDQGQPDVTFLQVVTYHVCSFSSHLSHSH